VRDPKKFLVVLGFEPGALCLLGKYSTTCHTLQSSLLIVSFSDRVFCFCPWTLILLSVPLNSWDYRFAPPYPTSVFFFSNQLPSCSDHLLNSPFLLTDLTCTHFLLLCNSVLKH
jgi:hypothetical protein